jgi:hypothetical protein
MAMDNEPERRSMPIAARRARAEAEARHQAREVSPPAEREVGGPKGPDPVRYGDWERDGIASDF